ncbi:hypothetical protein HMPREF9103_03015 [Lentilactobacillus parafarraginis F0439]|uniref:Uncharacterized protein n=1 Tax=Lentilactobacillus parafarraginis F0439 TaxID=797515 RepID=G9ZTD0_9LACO|nr:hypothetical protein HMPREF9103_03015 [Lentilactobacillus parafarraginis F0439]
MTLTLSSLFQNVNEVLNIYTKLFLTQPDSKACGGKREWPLLPLASFF